jgi:hypothetical protein
MEGFMSIMYPKDCLAHHLARPLFRQIDVSSVSCSVVSEQIKAFTKAPDFQLVSPETEALEFYLGNHALALVQQKFHPLEPLPPEYLALVEGFFAVANKAARRAMFYLILICTRETRHLHGKDGWMPKLTAMYGKEVADYVSSLPDSATTAMNAFVSGPPKANIGPYIEALYHVFYYGSWGHGYGGTAWAEVTDCLRSFISGKFSLLMMLDTVWTLCHNNGPIFNKQMLYRNYSLGGKDLLRILDVQRAGMIPTYLATCNQTSSNGVTMTLVGQSKILCKLFDLPTEMDWIKVNSLGSVMSYTTDGDVYSAGHKPKPIKLSKPAASVNIFNVCSGFELVKIKMERAA